MIEQNVLGDLWVATLIRPNVKYHVGTFKTYELAATTLIEVERLYDSDDVSPLPPAVYPK